MAARTRRTTLNEKWRQKIKTSMLINRLQDHADGKCDMKSTQVRAAEILLSKTVPSVSQVDSNIQAEVSGSLLWKVKLVGNKKD